MLYRGRQRARNEEVQAWSLHTRAPLRVLLWELHLASFYYKGFDLFTLREFISCLNKAGFVVEDVIDISHIDSPSKLVIARRA
jgi:hypothetical protein